MKILMATHYFASHRGGIEIVAKRLCEEFGAVGEDITWVAGCCASPSDTLARCRTVCLPVVNIVEKKTGFPFPIPTIRALQSLREEIVKADVLIIHDCLYLTNIVVFLMAKKRGIPILLVQHIGVIPYRNRLLKMLMACANRMVTKPMLTCADQIVFISYRTKEFFARVHLKKDPSVIFNGVDSATYQPVPSTETKSELRTKLELPSSGPIILFVGRFVEKKGLHVMKEMARSRPNYTWVFAGWGPLDPRTWNADNVRVFSNVDGTSLAEIYRASDLFVLPSSGEGLPLVVQEALASGLSVICGADTARADPEMTSFVHAVPVDPENHQRTAGKFLGVIDDLARSDGALNEQMAQCRAFAISRYSWSAAARQYLELLSQLIKTRSSTVCPSELRAQKVVE